MTHDPTLHAWLNDADAPGPTGPDDTSYDVALSELEDLVARVREDDLNRWTSIRSSLEQKHRQRGYAVGYLAGRKKGWQDAVEAVNAAPGALDSSAEWERDYDVDPTGQTRNPRIWVREAVAAIQELGADR